MIKRTLYFGNQAYLKTNNEQLVFKSIDKGKTILVTIEDIGVAIKTASADNHYTNQPW